MNTFEVCKAVCHLSETIAGAGIIVDNKLVAMDARPGVAVPNDDRFEKMFFQATLIANIMIGNSDFFGQARYFTLHFQNADLFFFLLSDHGIQGVLAVQVLQQHDHEEIVSRINALLADSL
ncbi:MAG: hypothetical protein ABI361_09885 [Nitrososphaera sp.]|jgi:hypothetical protein